MNYSYFICQFKNQFFKIIFVSSENFCLYLRGCDAATTIYYSNFLILTFFEPSEKLTAKTQIVSIELKKTGGNHKLRELRRKRATSFSNCTTQIIATTGLSGAKIYMLLISHTSMYYPWVLMYEYVLCVRLRRRFSFCSASRSSAAVSGNEGCGRRRRRRHFGLQRRNF